MRNLWIACAWALAGTSASASAVTTVTQYTRTTSTLDGIYNLNVGDLFVPTVPGRYLYYVNILAGPAGKTVAALYDQVNLYYYVRGTVDYTSHYVYAHTDLVTSVRLWQSDYHRSYLGLMDFGLLAHDRRYDDQLDTTGIQYGNNRIQFEGGANAPVTYSVRVDMIPEPSSWALMIAGFGSVGGAMRTRQRVSVKFA